MILGFDNYLDSIQGSDSPLGGAFIFQLLFKAVESKLEIHSFSNMYKVNTFRIFQYEAQILNKEDNSSE